MVLLTEGLLVVMMVFSQAYWRIPLKAKDKCEERG
jgi:hypothetical protein